MRILVSRLFTTFLFILLVWAMSVTSSHAVTVNNPSFESCTSLNQAPPSWTKVGTDSSSGCANDISTPYGTWMVVIRTAALYYIHQTVTVESGKTYLAKVYTNGYIAGRLSKLNVGTTPNGTQYCTSGDVDSGGIFWVEASCEFTATGTSAIISLVSPNSVVRFDNVTVEEVVTPLDHYNVTTTTPQGVGGCWSETVEARDSGDALIATDTSTVDLTSSSVNVVFYTSGTCVTPTTTATLSSGTATIYMKTEVSEVITITVTKQSDTETGTSGNITVNPASLDHYDVTNFSSHLINEGWSETITAKDVYGNILSSDTSTVNLSSSGNLIFYTDNTYITTTTTATLSGGMATIYMKVPVSELVTYTATKQGSSETGTSETILVETYNTSARIFNMGGSDCSAPGAASDCSQTWTSVLQQTKFDDRTYPSEYVIAPVAGGTVSSNGWTRLYHADITNSSAKITAPKIDTPTSGTFTTEHYIYFPETISTGDLTRVGWHCVNGTAGCTVTEGLFIDFRAENTPSTRILLYSNLGANAYTYDICAHPCAIMPVTGDVWFVRLSGNDVTNTIYWYIERNGTAVYSGNTSTSYLPTQLASNIYNLRYLGTGTTEVYHWGGYTYLDDSPLIIYNAATNSSAVVVNENGNIVVGCVNESSNEIAINIGATYSGSSTDKFKHQGRILYYTQLNCAGNVVDQFPGHGEISTQIFNGNKYKILSSINQGVYETLFKEIMWGAYKANQLAGGNDLKYVNVGTENNGSRYGVSLGQWLGIKCPTGAPCDDNTITWNGDSFSLTELYVKIMEGAHSESHIRIRNTYRLSTIYYGRKMFADEPTLTTSLINSITASAHDNLDAGVSPDDAWFGLMSKIWMRLLYLDPDVGNRSLGLWLPQLDLGSAMYDTTSITSSIVSTNSVYASIGGMTTSNYLYLGGGATGLNVTHPIDAVKVVMGPDLNSNTSTMTAQYCSANDNVATSCDTWTTVPGGITDGTSVGGVTFAQSGEVYLNTPNSITNWARSTEAGGAQNWYLRLSVSASLSGTVTVDEFDYRGEYTYDCASGNACNLTNIDNARVGYGLWDEQIESSDLDHYDNYSQLVASGLATYLIDGDGYRAADVSSWIKETVKVYSGILDRYGKGVAWGRSIAGGGLRFTTGLYLQAAKLGYVSEAQMGSIKRAMDMYVLESWNKQVNHRWAYVFKDLSFAGSSAIQESYIVPSNVSGLLIEFINFPELFIDSPDGTYWNATSSSIRSELYNYGELLGQNKLAYHSDYTDNLVFMLNAGNRNNQGTDFMRGKYTPQLWSNIFYQSVGTVTGLHTGSNPVGYGYVAPIMTGITPSQKTTTIKTGFIGDGMVPLAYQTGAGYEYTAIAINNHFMWVVKYTPTATGNSYLYSLPLSRLYDTAVHTDTGTYGGCQTSTGKSVCFKALKSSSVPVTNANTISGYLYAQNNRVNMYSSAVRLDTGSKISGTAYYEIFDMGLKLSHLSYSDFDGYSSFVSSSGDDHQVNGGLFKIYLRTGTAKNETSGYTVGSWTIKGGTIRGFAGTLSGDDKFGGIGLKEVKIGSDIYLTCTSDCDVTFDAKNPEVQLGLLKVSNLGTTSLSGSCGSFSGDYVVVKLIALSVVPEYIYGKDIDGSWDLLTEGSDYYECSGDLVFPKQTIALYDYPHAEFKINLSLPSGDDPNKIYNFPWNSPWTEELNNDDKMVYHTTDSYN